MLNPFKIFSNYILFLKQLELSEISYFLIFILGFFLIIKLILVGFFYFIKDLKNEFLLRCIAKIHFLNLNLILNSFKSFILYCSFIYYFFLFFFKIKIVYYCKNIVNTFCFIFLKIPLNLGKFFTILTLNIFIIWPFLFIKYLLGSWVYYFSFLSLIFSVYIFLITYKVNINILNFYFYNQEELKFLNFNLYNLLNPSFFDQKFKSIYNSNIENFTNRKDFFFSNINSIGTLNFIKNYYMTKNPFISESIFNANDIVRNLNPLYYLETKPSPSSNLNFKNDFFFKFQNSSPYVKVENGIESNRDTVYINYSFLNKLKHLNLIQHKQIYSIYLNSAFFQLNTTNADWYQIKSMYTNNWLNTNEVSFYLTNSFFLELLNLFKFIIFYALNCIFPSDIFFLWVKYLIIEKMCVILNLLISYINSNNVVIYAEIFIKFLIFSLPDKFLFDLGYLYKIQIYTLVEIIFDHFFGLCLKIYKIYNINIGNHSTTKKLLLLFTDAGLEYKAAMQQEDYSNDFKDEITLQSYPFLAQYNESDYLAFSTYSLYTKWRRYCYVIEGSPFFQEQTNIHTYTSTSTPAGLSDELDHLELQNIIILEELSAKQDYPNFNYWSFWADLNINFDNFDKDNFVKENILKGNIFPGNLYDCFEFNNIPFFGGDKTILFKTYPTQMSYSFENFFSYGNNSTKLRFHKLFTTKGKETGETENSREHHLTTNSLEDYSVFAKYLKNLINLEISEKKNPSFYIDTSEKFNNNIEFNFDLIFNFQKQLTIKDFNLLYENNTNFFFYQKNEILDFYQNSNKINRIFNKKIVKIEKLVSEVFRLVQVPVGHFFFYIHHKNHIMYGSEQTLSQDLFTFLNTIFQGNIDNLNTDNDNFIYKMLNSKSFLNINKETKKQLNKQILLDIENAGIEFENQLLYQETYETMEGYDDGEEEDIININSLKFFSYEKQNSVKNLYSKFFSTFESIEQFFLLMQPKGNPIFFLENNLLKYGISCFSQDFKHAYNILGDSCKDDRILKRPRVNTHSLFYFWLKSLDSNLFISKEIGKYQIHNELSFPSFRTKTLLANMYTLQVYFLFYFLLHFFSIIVNFYLEIIYLIFLGVVNFNLKFLIVFIMFYFMIRLFLILYYIVYLNYLKIEYNYKNLNNYQMKKFYFKIIKLKILFESWVLFSRKEQNKLISVSNKKILYFFFFVCILLFIEFLAFLINVIMFLFNLCLKKILNHLLSCFFNIFIFFGFINKIFLISLLYSTTLINLIKKKYLYFFFLLVKFLFYYTYKILKLIVLKIIIPLYFFYFFWLFIKIFFNLYNIELSDLYPTYLMLLNVFFLLYLVSLLLKNFSNLIFESKLNIIDLNFYAQEDFYETYTYNDTNPDETLAANSDNFENPENIYWETLYYHPQPEKMAKDFFITDEGFLISDMIRKSNQVYDLMLLRKLNIFFFEKIKNSFYYNFTLYKNLNLTNLFKNTLLNFYELHYRFFSVTVYFFTYVLLHLNKIKSFEHRLFIYNTFIYMFWYKFQDENLDRTKDIDIDDLSFYFILYNSKRDPLYFKQRILYSDFVFSEEETFLKNSFIDEVFLVKFFDLDTTEQNPIFFNKNNKVFDLSLYNKKRLSFLFDDILDTNSIKLRKFLLNGYLNSKKYTSLIILNNPFSFIKDNSFLHVEEDDLFTLFDFELGLNVDYLDYYLQFYLGLQTKFHFYSSFSDFYIKIINPFEIYDNKFKYQFFSNIKFYIKYLNLKNFPNLSKKEFEKLILELNCTELEWDSLEIKKKKHITFPFNVIEFTIFFLFFFNFFITKNNEEHFWSLLINHLDVRSEDEAVILENSALSNLNLSEPSLFSTQFFEFIIFYTQNFFDKLVLTLSLPNNYTHNNLWFFFKELFLIFYFLWNLFENFFFYLPIKFNISYSFIFFVDFLVYFQFFFVRILNGFLFYDFFFLFINFFNIYIIDYIYISYLIFFFLFNLFIYVVIFLLFYIILCFSYFYLFYLIEKINKNKKNKE
jgi:hypothetical protein